MCDTIYYSGYEEKLRKFGKYLDLDRKNKW